MSSRFIRRIALAGLLAAAIASTRFAVAGAESLESLIANGALPSAAPALLAPIAESGRAGWACAPERAAAAKRAHEAELPAANPSL
ncbi:MAG TPA: hypothetical protein VIG32_02575 [Candidatus Baltobacteraceae bacterium]|jgi:hypothetical protein